MAIGACLGSTVWLGTEDDNKQRYRSDSWEGIPVMNLISLGRPLHILPFNDCRFRPPCTNWHLDRSRWSCLLLILSSFPPCCSYDCHHCLAGIGFYLCRALLSSVGAVIWELALSSDLVQQDRTQWSWNKESWSMDRQNIQRPRFGAPNSGLIFNSSIPSRRFRHPRKHFNYCLSG